MLNLRTLVKRGKSYLRKVRSARNFRRRYFADQVVDLAAVTEFRSEVFPPSTPFCWLDRPDADDEVDRRLLRREIDEEQAAICRHWIVNGFYVAKKLIDSETLDRTWVAYETALAEGILTAPPEGQGAEDPYPGRILDPHLIVPEIRTLMHDARILRLTDLLLGRKTIPFQTIIGHKGSQQLAHSDAIHMTTYPLGYLVANWIAFEDIHPDSGPLEYYPKSHRFPYLLSEQVGIAPYEFKEKGGAVYASRYEPAMRQHCENLGHRPDLFCPEKGDVLFWHANLVHGGSPRQNLERSRKALVCHHFAEGAFTYHDLSGNVTRLHSNGVYAPYAL